MNKIRAEHLSKLHNTSHTDVQGRHLQYQLKDQLKILSRGQCSWAFQKTQYFHVCFLLVYACGPCLYLAENAYKHRLVVST